MCIQPNSYSPLLAVEILYNVIIDVPWIYAVSRGKLIRRVHQPQIYTVIPTTKFVLPLKSSSAQHKLLYIFYLQPHITNYNDNLEATKYRNLDGKINIRYLSSTYT